MFTLSSATAAAAAEVLLGRVWRYAQVLRLLRCAQAAKENSHVTNITQQTTVTSRLSLKQSETLQLFSSFHFHFSF